MTRESTDTDTAEQVIDSFRILAGDKVRFFTLNYLITDPNYYYVLNLFTAIHHGRRTKERTATGPGGVLHTANATLQGSQRNAWSPGLPLLLHSTLRRVGFIKNSPRKLKKKKKIQKNYKKVTATKNIYEDYLYFRISQKRTRTRFFSLASLTPASRAIKKLIGDNQSSAQSIVVQRKKKKKKVKKRKKMKRKKKKEKSIGVFILLYKNFLNQNLPFDIYIHIYSFCLFVKISYKTFIVP